MNKCTVCYPIVFQIIEMKFEGEKTPHKVIIRAWKQCENEAVEHIIDYVDARNPLTMFTLHHCQIHVDESKKIKELMEKSE